MLSSAFLDHDHQDSAIEDVWAIHTAQDRWCTGVLCCVVLCCVVLCCVVLCCVVNQQLAKIFRSAEPVRSIHAVAMVLRISLASNVAKPKE